MLSHVDSTARARRVMARTLAESGMSDAQWWDLVGPVLEQVMADGDLVLSARVGGAVGAEFNATQDPAHALMFGLDTILDGIETRIAGRSAHQPNDRGQAPSDATAVAFRRSPWRTAPSHGR